MTIKRFEDIEAWQLGRELVRAIYRVSKSGEFARDFALRDQVRRAALSITSNIAEGFERGGNREFIQALSIAKGSAGEGRSELYTALDESYLSESEFNTLCDQCLRLSRVIAGFINFLQGAPIAGPKYRDRPKFMQLAGRIDAGLDDVSTRKGFSTKGDTAKKTRNQKP